MKTLSFCLAVGLLAAASPAQLSQTLPAGFDTTFGASGSAFPFNQTSDHKWQWHYDSGQFAATFPIIITEVYVRGLSGAAIPAWNFPSVEIVMASSPTDYSVAGNGVQAGHSTTFANNLNTDATIVRPAAPWIGSQTVGGWEPLGLSIPFLYDPTVGDDFIVEITKCGTVTTWGTSIDGATGSAGLNGGNRYGDTSSCSNLVSSFSNNEYVPIVRIDYVPAMGLYAGFTATPTSGSAPLTVQFTDASYSSAGPVLLWGWDFGDGNVSTQQNPSHTYVCPGTYDVTLVVQDGLNPTSTLVRTGYISVPGIGFSMSTTGAGDLTVNPVGTVCGLAGGAADGWTLPSFATASPVGTGPVFGIVPDALTWNFFLVPAGVGDLRHFLVDGVNYPDAGPLVFPAGTFSGFSGMSLDAVMVFRTPGGFLGYVSNTARVTF